MNKSLIKKVLQIFFFLTFPLSISASSVLPVGKMEYEFIYDRLERYEALSFDYYDYQLGPYHDNEQQTSFGPFDYLKQIPSKKIELFSFIGEDIYSVKESSTIGYESIRGGIAASPLNKIFIYSSFLLDERKARDENYIGKKWRGLAGGVEEAFVYYKSNLFEIFMGRYASFWGPRRSLVLSSKNALDGFGYIFHWGRLAFSYRLAKLDRIGMASGLALGNDTLNMFENRYFAGHRLDIHLSKKIRVGLFETIIFGGTGRQMDLYYLNPIIFYHIYQLNQGLNDNTFLGFDFTYKPKRGVRLYGQLLVDDFQIDKKSQGDQEPDQYGIIIGGSVIDFIPAYDINMEYSRVTNWTFNQTHRRNRYLFNNQLIGGALGNDYDNLQISITRWFNEDLAVLLKFSYFRQGEGRVTDDWTEPWLDVTGSYSEPFPTGNVERTKRMSINVKGFAVNHFFFDIETGFEKINNYRHIKNDDRSLPFISLKLSSFFSSSLNIE